MLKVIKPSYGQNSLLIIYDDKWFKPSYVASRLFCTCVVTIPMYGKPCVHRTLGGEVLEYNVLVVGCLGLRLSQATLEENIMM